MTYWLDQAGRVEGIKQVPNNDEVLIIGSGLSGVSVGYFLQEHFGSNITIVDCGTENASYFRNAGHVLHGTGESYKAMRAIHGNEKAKEIMQMSVGFIEQAQETINKLNIDCDYHKGDYLLVGKTENEEKELRESTQLMIEDGFTQSSIIDRQQVKTFGFKMGMCLCIFQ